MESTVKQRLIAYLAYKRIGQIKFAKMAGLSGGFVGNIRQSIQPKTLSMISKAFPDLNTAWLITGIGDMIINNDKPPEITKKTNEPEVSYQPNSVKDRMVRFLHYKGLSQRKFESLLHLPNGYVNNIRSSISPEKLSIITKSFPDLSAIWLLTGQGEMIQRTLASANNHNNIHKVPLYSLSSLYGGTINADPMETVISPLAGVDFALRVINDSMAPEIPKGSQIFVKKVDENVFLEWGSVYVLDTVNGVLIKRIEPAESEENITCYSTNALYKPFDVPRSGINAYYRVIMCMSMI